MEIFTRIHNHASRSADLSGVTTEPGNRVDRPRPVAGIRACPLTKLFAAYTTVCQRASYKKQRTLKKELFETRQKLGLTSAQDEFAKWARLRRSVDKLTQDLDQMSE